MTDPSTPAEAGTVVTRIRSRWAWVVVVSFAAVALFFGISSRSLRSAAKAQRASAAADAAKRMVMCQFAQTSALQTVEQVIRSAELRVERETPIPTGLGTGQVGNGLAIYLLACVSNDAVDDLRFVLADYVDSLIDVGNYTTLRALLVELRRRPVEDWASIPRPHAPSLIDRIGGGDPARRKQMLDAADVGGFDGVVGETIDSGGSRPK